MVLAQRAAAVIAILMTQAAASGLQDRIDAAAPGATLRVGPGEYEGPLVIGKPLALLGDGFPEIDGGGRGSVISIRADGVTIRGFHIHNSGADLRKDDAGIHIGANDAVITDNRIEDVLHGVYVKKANGFRISKNAIRGKTELDEEDRPMTESIATDGADLCSPLNINSRGNGIHLWNSTGGEIDGNTVTDTRDGMYFSFTSDTKVRGNAIHGVRYGLHYMYSDRNNFEGNTFADSAAGAAIMYSKNLVIRGNRFNANRGFRAYGMLLNSVDATRIEENFLTNNTVGIYIENNNNNVISGNHIENNYIGVRMTASSNDNVFTRNRFAGNMHSAELAGQNESNHWSLDGVGNYWGDSAPVDLDGDSIGDLPHREVDLLGPLRRDLPMVGLLSGGPGLELLQFARRHGILPDVDAIEDPSPLTPGFNSP
jgi:nitrous oxidase accessory protein